MDGGADSPNEGEQTPPELWRTLTPFKRKLILAAFSIGFLSLILADILFRTQDSIPGGVNQAILYTPFQLTAISYSGLALFSIITGMRSIRGSRVEPVTLRLGTAWVVASIPLIIDYMIDPFEPKIPVVALFLFVGVRYWSGARNSYLGLVTAPLMVAIASLDGLFHLMGNFCSATAFDSCSVKGISDVYLTMIFFTLTYMTIAGRSRRMGVKELVIVIAVAGLIILGLAFTP